MDSIMHEIIASMTVDEKRALVSKLKAAIAEELMPDPADPGTCPRCGSPSYVCKGRRSDGSQRWLCKHCNTTFGATTRGLLAASKLEPAIWMAYAECMADALSLRECARRCSVSLPTSWFMRQRVCEVMRSRLQPFRKCAACQVDGLVVEENLSGNHSRSVSFDMPRKRHRSGSDGHSRGISNEKVCVMTGVNEYGDEFAVLCCRGRESSKDVHAALEGLVSNDTEISTDMHKSYPRAMGALGAASHVTVDPNDRSTGDINLVNSMHSRLRDFLRRFHGVATRRLQRYLDWFCYAEQFRNSDADRREILYADASAGRYERTRRETFRMPHPFMEYWDKQMFVSNLV